MVVWFLCLLQMRFDREYFCVSEYARTISLWLDDLSRPKESHLYCIITSSRLEKIDTWMYIILLVIKHIYMEVLYIDWRTDKYGLLLLRSLFDLSVLYTHCSAILDAIVLCRFDGNRKIWLDQVIIYSKTKIISSKWWL